MAPAYASWVGRQLQTSDDAVLGSVTDVFAGVDDDAPRWVEVTTSSGQVVLLPATGVVDADTVLTTPHDHATLLASPSLTHDDNLSVDDEERLDRHYASGPGAPADGAAGDPDQVEVVRAAERLHIETSVQPAGAVRLRKWVETRTVSEQVVVHQERVRVEREPVGLAESAGPLSGVEIGAAEYEVVLRDEQVVASKVTVPQEVVRLTRDVVAETVVVEADLAEERVEVEKTGRADDRAGRP